MNTGRKLSVINLMGRGNEELRALDANKSQQGAVAVRHTLKQIHRQHKGTSTPGAQ